MYSAAYLVWFGRMGILRGSDSGRCTKCTHDMHKMICCIYWHTNDDGDGWSSTIEVLEDCMYRIIAQLNGYWIAICS